MKEDDASTLRRAFGAAVRARRQALGLSQEELAARADLHRTYVGDIERGRRNVALPLPRRGGGALAARIAAAERGWGGGGEASTGAV